MGDDDRRSPEYRQARREAFDQRKSNKRARFVGISAFGAVTLGAALFPADTGLADRVRAAVGAWYDAHPHDPGASIEQAACHEGGHFVMAEALGMVATKAKIHGSPFGRTGWSGSAGAMERPVFDGGHWGFTADDVEQEAAFALAGPVAEHLFAIVGPFAPVPWKRGNLYISLGEILEACVLAAHLADLRGEGRAATLVSLFMRTAQAVLYLNLQIQEIALRLKSQRSIGRHKRETLRVLNCIDRASLKNLPPLTDTEAQTVHGIISDAPTDLVRFTEEVGQ